MDPKEVLRKFVDEQTDPDVLDSMLELLTSMTKFNKALETTPVPEDHYGNLLDSVDVLLEQKQDYQAMAGRLCGTMAEQLENLRGISKSLNCVCDSIEIEIDYYSYRKDGI